MSNYAKGATLERRIAAELVQQDYFVLRAAGSHSPVDLIALKRRELPLLIQVKGGARRPWSQFSLLERRALLRVAEQAGGTAVLIWKPPRGETQWFYGPTDWPQASGGSSSA